MSQMVMVKESVIEGGIGSVPAMRIAESNETEYGAFAHFSETADGRFFLSITDMEEHHGSYMSVELRADDPWVQALKGCPS